MIASLLFVLCFTCNALRLPPSELDNEWIKVATQSITNALGRRTKEFRDDRQPLTLMFGNYDYREVVINQMLGFHTLNLTNYAVVCLDQQLADLMVSIGKPCIADLVGGGLRSIWQVRLHVVENLLGNGTSVLLTDADAVWIKSPMEFLKDADIVTQRGSFPSEVGEHLGATACMGFAYFAGNSAVSSFFHEEVMSKFKNDDQRALNEALMDNGIHFDHKLDYVQSRQIDRGIIPAKVHRRELHVNFLDHYRFPRHCPPSIHADTVIAHCMSKKTGGSKISELKTMSLCWLKDDWEQAPRNKGFEAFIASIASVSVIQKQAIENSRLSNADHERGCNHCRAA